MDIYHLFHSISNKNSNIQIGEGIFQMKFQITFCDESISAFSKTENHHVCAFFHLIFICYKYRFKNLYTANFYYETTTKLQKKSCSLDFTTTDRCTFEGESFAAQSDCI